MIEGELDNNGLNLSVEDRELIKDSHIVFHGAATVRFDDKLRFAVNINVRGTKEILLLCRQMPNLKVIFRFFIFYFFIMTYFNTKIINCTFRLSYTLELLSHNA